MQIKRKGQPFLFLFVPVPFCEFIFPAFYHRQPFIGQKNNNYFGKLFDRIIIIIIIAITNNKLNQAIMSVTQCFPAPNKFNLHISCRAMTSSGGLAGLVAKCTTKNLCEPMRN